jgi:hypothetical protein
MPQFNSFIDTSCKIGDLAYFGIHDLSKNYRENGFLPTLKLFDIFDKKGEISKIDPVGRTVTLILNKSPFYYGYRKLDSDLNGTKKYMFKNGKVELKIPISSLELMTSIMEDDSIPVFLVIDGNTKYQKNLMRALRNKEIERVKNKNITPQPCTRHYDQFEGDNFSFDDVDEICTEGFNPCLTSKLHKWKYFTADKRYKYYT